MDQLEALPRITVAPTTEQDLDFVLALEHADENRRWIIPWPRERHVRSLADPGLRHVTVNLDAKRVGYMIIAGLGDPNQSIELRRIVIADRRRGLGRAAVRWLISQAFGPWNAHRLWLDVKPENVGARRLYESVGFVSEGVLRECIKSEGKFESLLVMSILRHEHDRMIRSEKGSETR